jgi:hypothetical protein
MRGADARLHVAERQVSEARCILIAAGVYAVERLTRCFEVAQLARKLAGLGDGTACSGQRCEDAW